MDQIEFTTANIDEIRRHWLTIQLNEIRLKRKLTQKMVGRRMRGVVQSAVADFESGTIESKTSTMQAYARAVGYRIEFKLVKDDRTHLRSS